MEGFNLPISKGIVVQLGDIFIKYRNSPLFFNEFQLHYEYRLLN